jgi:hypothetical protein
MASEQNQVQIFPMGFVEFLSPKIAILRGETVRICNKHEKQQICWDKNS